MYKRKYATILPSLPRYRWRYLKIRIFYSNSSYGTSTASHLITTNSPCQDVVNQLQQLTNNYNKSPHCIQQRKPTNTQNTLFQDSTSFSSSSTTPSIPLTTIPYPSYHDYIFNTNHNPSTNTTTTTINHHQSPAIPPPTTPSAQSNAENIGSIHLKSTTIKARSTTFVQSPQYQSDSS